MSSPGTGPLCTPVLSMFALLPRATQSASTMNDDPTIICDEVSYTVLANNNAITYALKNRTQILVLGTFKSIALALRVVSLSQVFITSPTVHMRRTCVSYWRRTATMVFKMYSALVCSLE